ncbi:hypothetical protein [Pararhizobium sp. PWRC1-1]|uniref:hypothetical protein n=1 Tax=Pararhizobium sp. PWRC1-1 TaxID=2804566 RepID=UPI003CEA0A89
MGIRTWLGLKKKRPVAEQPPEPPPFWNEHSFAQIQQDRWVLAELDGKRGGFFVEIGAFDGKQLSNTYLLETEYDWKGILAEPNPLLDGIRKVRHAALYTHPVDAVSGKSVKMRFVADHPELSSMVNNAFKDRHAH